MGLAQPLILLVDVSQNKVGGYYIPILYIQSTTHL